ncbi:MAG: DUF4249 domain-containing protein [Sphingobacteriales bacterium]|nr:DUF4249 domain-containing protein [Sphingobacteriales bacterium]
MNRKYKNYFFYLTFLITVLSFGACESVINLNLKDAKPAIVIEANVTDRAEPQIVFISQTKPFNQNNTINPVSQAVVTVFDEDGNQHQFFETIPGKYVSASFAGVSGKKYTIQVKVEGTLYTASSLMPQKVLLDSLSLTELSFFNDTKKYVQVHFNDPVAEANQYNYVLYVNDEIRNAYYVDNDRFNDGKNVTNTIFNSDPALKKGDSVTVDFQCIDEPIYRYFFTLSQIAGNGGPPTAPANPDSNFDNGALGYFSAHTSQKKSNIIP